MKHEMMRQPASTQVGENVGDVLASIRRLIAQDEAGSPIPDHMLNKLGNLPERGDISRPHEAADHEAAPLILNQDDQIATESPDPPNEDSATAEAAESAEISPWQRAVSEIDFGKLWTDAPESTADLPNAGRTGSNIHRPDFLTSAFNDTQSSTHQTEDNMLQANASVTPINANFEALSQIEDDVLRDSGEPHLFAPKDKDSQKGTHLRGMIREAIRQELQGEIGNRLSRNLQQMIRHEIEAALRQMCEQD